MGNSAALSNVLSALLGNREFHRQCNSQQFEELRSLQEETDRGFLGEALFAYAQRLERGDGAELSIEIYRQLAAALPESPLLERVRARFNALMGRGPVMARIEDLARRFASEATNPAMLLSFAVAGGLASWVRRAGLASFALRGGGFFSRGYGARFLAGSAAFLAEVPAFVATNRLSREVLGGPSLRGENSLGQELAGAAIFLGCLKLSAFAGQEIVGRLTQVSSLRGGAGSLASLSGIYLAHRVEESAGLRPQQDGANRWVDSLHAWLQMAAGARLVGSDSRGAMLEGRLREAVSVAGLNRSFSPENLPEGALQWQIAASFEEPTLRAEASVAVLSQSSPERALMIQRWGEPAARRFLPDLEASARLLGQRPEDLERLALRSQLQDPEVLEAGWARLHYMLRHSDSVGLTGHYLNYVARLFALECMRRGDIVRLDSFFTELHRGSTLDRVERLVAPMFPEYDLYRLMPRSVDRFASPPNVSFLQHFRQSEVLPVSEDARRTIRRFLRSHGEIESHVLPELRELMIQEPEWQSAFEAALLRSKSSPLAYLRIFRLLNSTERGERLYPKVLELAEPETRVLPYRERVIGFQSEFPRFGSQQDAYIADTHFSQYLGDFHRDWRQVRRTLLRALHETWAMDMIRDVWPSPRPLTRGDVVHVLKLLDDPMTTPIGEALVVHDIDLRILDDSAFNAMARRFNGDDRGDLWTGFTVRGDYTYPQDLIVIRQVGNASSTVFHDLVFERLVALVHEFEHHAHPVAARTPQMGLLREEMAAHLRHLHFRARNGFPESVERILRVSPLGIGMYLRDHVESAYLRRSAGSSFNVRALEPFEISTDRSSEGETSTNGEDSR